MTFSDIFKSGFLENISAVSIPEMALALLLALGVGLFIFLVYKKTYSGVMYSTSFGVTLIALTMISTLVILAVTSNVVLSLGMVGALSIVRFRTAIKEPLDIAFLFWAIAAGIVLAAGMIPLTVIGSCLIGLVLLIFVNRKSHVTPYMMVIRTTDHAGEVRAVEAVRKNVKRMVLKGKSVSKGEVEMNFEVRLNGENTDFVNEINELEGVKSCVLVTYNGEYMG
ncbi:MAG: DUF4956 domain-containing protein [Clostridia bacterium]|nr:DUF4956 domain-containing protein [Clostridiales bacterium]MBQ6717089.1 DUF4956 domain-containing protein [Clostridia bacterium]